MQVLRGGGGGSHRRLDVFLWSSSSSVGTEGKEREEATTSFVPPCPKTPQWNLGGGAPLRRRGCHGEEPSGPPEQTEVGSPGAGGKSILRGKVSHGGRADWTGDEAPHSRPVPRQSRAVPGGQEYPSRRERPGVVRGHGWRGRGASGGDLLDLDGGDFLSIVKID